MGGHTFEIEKGYLIYIYKVLSVKSLCGSMIPDRQHLITSSVSLCPSPFLRQVYARSVGTQLRRKPVEAGSALVDVRVCGPEKDADSKIVPFESISIPFRTTLEISSLTYPCPSRVVGKRTVRLYAFRGVVNPAIGALVGPEPRIVPIAVR